jgi:hypothetical protein
MPGAQPPQPYQYPPPPPPASPPKHSMFVKVLSTLLGLLVAAAVTQIVNVEWHVAEVGGGVSRLQAQQLLVRYYAAVVNPNTAKTAWDTMLTSGAQKDLSGGLPKFESFWREWSEVKFDPVQPVSENTFQAEMTYIDHRGRLQSWRKQVWVLECSSSLKYVPFRSCPDDKIQLKDAYVQRS